jgi:hypothetical protein
MCVKVVSVVRKGRAIIHQGINHIENVPLDMKNKKTGIIYKKFHSHKINGQSIPFVRHRGPNFFILVKTAAPETKPTKPRIVNSQPFPIALMMGDATIAPTHENKLRTKLLSATPAEDFRGRNSVSMVTETAKISMLPIPKAKFAIIWCYFFISK